MNRLSPLIARRPRAFALAAGLPAPRADSPALAASGPDDLRLFLTSFLAGLVFFGTYLA